jgi:hypothetical protein
MNYILKVIQIYYKNAMRMRPPPGHSHPTPENKRGGGKREFGVELSYDPKEGSRIFGFRMAPGVAHAASGGPLLFARCVPFAILKPKNRKTGAKQRNLR